MIPQKDVTSAIGVAHMWAAILRRHSNEAQKAATDEDPEKWITDRAGWETLVKQLNEAAEVLEGMGRLAAALRAEDKEGEL